MAKVFARKICSTFFNDTFAWDDEKGCYPIPTCDQSDEHFLFSSESVSGAVGFNCKKFPEMVCSKEVSFKAWQNWWDGDTKHYMAFRAAPLYKENGNWKICTEVQFVHDGSAIPTVTGDAGDKGGDTGSGPSDLFTNCSYSGNPCSISVTGSETPVELQNKQNNYKDCLLESKNYCVLNASCQGAIETFMNEDTGFIHPCLTSTTNFCKTGSNTCVECNKNDECSPPKKCISNKCSDSIDWSKSKQVRCSTGSGINKARACCAGIGRQAVTVADIEKDKSKACNEIGRWDIVAILGGKFDGRGYGCKITKGTSGGAGVALCR